MNYKVRIKSPNKIFTIKNRPIRTPFETVVTENGLEAIKARISFYGLSIQDYEIREIKIYKEIDSDSKKNEYSQIQPKKQKFEESESKRTITENLTKPKETINEAESKSSSKLQNQNPVILKQKIINNSPKTSYQKQQPQELTTDSKTSSEQNINTNIEISIEELNDKSTSLLEKFLKSEF